MKNIENRMKGWFIDVPTVTLESHMMVLARHVDNEMTKLELEIEELRQIIIKKLGLGDQCEHVYTDNSYHRCMRCNHEVVVTGDRKPK